MSKTPVRNSKLKKANAQSATKPAASIFKQRTHLLGASAMLLLLILTASSNHWYNTFHFDDAHTVENNAYIRSLTNIPSFFTNTQTFSSLPGHGSYRPIVSLTLAIDY
jgi:hypothetical protein